MEINNVELSSNKNHESNVISGVATPKRYNEKEILYNGHSSKSSMNIINRVLFVNHSIPPHEYSGTPIITLNHAIGMRKKGLEIAILIPSAEVKDGYVKEFNENYTLYEVPQLDKYDAYFGNVNQFQLNKYTYSIEKIIHEFQPQIVHINDYVFMPEEIVTVLSNSGAYIIRNVFNPEEICHLDSPVYLNEKKEVLCSGPDTVEKCVKCYITNVSKKGNNKIELDQLKEYSRKTQRRFEAIRLIYKENVDGMIFPDKLFKNYFKQFISYNDNIVKTIQLGFIFDKPRRYEYKKQPKGIIHIGLIGNLIPRKGINISLEAFEKIINLENFILDIYGANDLTIYQDLIKDMEGRYPEKIKYHGAFCSPDIENIADSIDIAIVPSYFETFNRIVRELMYYGVPIIATDFYGSSIVQDDINGIKIKTGDSNELADSIKKIILNPSLIEKLSRGVIATPIASLEAEVNEMYNFYNEVVEKKGIKQKIPSRYDKILISEQFIEKGNTKQAIEILYEVLSVNDENIDALNDIAIAFIMEKEYSKAFDHINHILKIDPQNVIAIRNLVYLKERVDIFREIKKSELLVEAEKYIHEKKYDDAETKLKVILQKNRENVDALNDLAVLNILNGNYRYAEEILDEVLRLEPGNEVANNNQMFIEQQKSKHEAE